MKKPTALICATFIILSMLILLVPVSAHPGGTDSNGGHYDKNTGEYHYHHGNPAHQHTNGCPYNYANKTNSNDNSGDSSGGCSGGCAGIITPGGIASIAIILSAALFLLRRRAYKWHGEE